MRMFWIKYRQIKSVRPVVLMMNVLMIMMVFFEGMAGMFDKLGAGRYEGTRVDEHPLILEPVYTRVCPYAIEKPPVLAW